MPVIIFEGPPLGRDRKAEMVRSFTDAAHRATGIPREAIIVLLHTNEKDNVGVGGELLPERLAGGSGQSAGDG